MTHRTPDRFETHRPMLIAGIRRHHEFTSSNETIPLQWEEFRSGGSPPGRVGSEAYGVICGSSTAGLEYLCGVEVTAFDAPPTHLGRIRIPERHYAVFVHEGHTSGLGRCWEEILAWLATSDFESAHTPDFERYDQSFGPETATGRVEVWVGVVAKRGQSDASGRN